MATRGPSLPPPLWTVRVVGGDRKELWLWLTSLSRSFFCLSVNLLAPYFGTRSLSWTPHSCPPGRGMGWHDCIRPVGLKPSWGLHLTGLALGSKSLCLLHDREWQQSEHPGSLLWRTAGSVPARYHLPPDRNRNLKSLLSSLNCVWVFCYSTLARL